MEHQDIVKKYLKEPGVEIGAFKTPIPNIKPIYVDRFDIYANEKTLADCYGDCCDLPFKNTSLLYVATSHVIEHTANPLAALFEWYRVLRHDGIIYMTIPDRRKTFDRARPLTPVKHLIDDYRNGVTQVDGTHIEEFVLGVDWKEFSPATEPHLVEEEQNKLVEIYKTTVANQHEINIHFHTFEPSSMVELITKAPSILGVAGSFEILEVVEDFPSSNPNGFLIVVRVKKNKPERLVSLWRKLRYQLNPRSIFNKKVKCFT